MDARWLESSGRPQGTRGRVQRIVYARPTAVATAAPTSGPAPLLVQFDDSPSTAPPAGQPLTYAWDLDGDGAFDDSSLVAPAYTYVVPGSYSDTESVALQPQTVDLAFESAPMGLSLTVNAASDVTPFTRRVIMGSTSSLAAPSPQTHSGRRWIFSSWSDGGAASHDVVAPAAGASSALPSRATAGSLRPPARSPRASRPRSHRRPATSSPIRAACPRRPRPR